MESAPRTRPRTLSGYLRAAALTTALAALVALFGLAVMVAAGPHLTFVEGESGSAGLESTRQATVSPDGRHVYAVGAHSDAVSVLSRNPTTGALTVVEVLKDGVDGVDGLDAAESVAISPDGSHVYVAGLSDDAVAVFSRNPTTGALSFVEVHKDGVDGVDGLRWAHSVTVSPDGRHLYAAAAIDNAVAVFSRNSTTGTLTFVEVHKDGVDGVDGLDGARSVAVSPDGKHLYTAAEFDNAVAVFSRDSTTGALTLVEVLKDGVGDIDGLFNPKSVTVSPDGRHFYSASVSAVAAFSRDSTTGALTFVEDHRDIVGHSGAHYVTVSPDGTHLYAAYLGGNSVGVFSRNSTTGALAFVEVHTDDVGGVRGLDGVWSVTASPDGKHLYASATRNNSVAVFSVTSADLSVTKSDMPDPVVAGASLTYTITVANNGPDTSTSVVLTDALPAGVTFTSASTGCSESGSTVTCNISDLAPNASTTVTIAVMAGFSTTAMVVNSAEAAGVEYDSVTGNNSAVATTTVLTATPVPSFSQRGLIVMAGTMAALLLWLRRRAMGRLGF